MAEILVVDDEKGIRAFIRGALEGEDHRVTEAADGVEAAALLERRAFHLMITDLKMPRLGGMALLERARESAPEMEVIVLTAHATVDTAVQAMKLGAFDYLTKPVSGPEELRLLAARALERRRLRSHRTQTTAAVKAREGMIAVDPRSRRVLAQIEKVAPTPATVLLLGESGTGKEVAAREIHRLSPRREGPFVAVNCAAVSPSLVESEIFGHEKGAFTGATERRQGRFELADGGALFLDEVAELPPGLQAKLLRVLQERTFERLGGTRTIRVDVRIIAATHLDLTREIAEGRFREDLYHRLAVFPLRLPPLRERPGDIEPLARHLLDQIARNLGRPRLELSEKVLARLRAYSWPGNVRELSNALERAAILCGGTTLDAGDLVLGDAGGLATAGSAAQAEGPAAVPPLKEVEKEAIRRALEATGGHRRQAAKLLGIGLRTLYDKIKAYGL